MGVRFRVGPTTDSGTTSGNCAWVVTGAGGDVMGGPVLSVLATQEACRSVVVVDHGRR